MGVGLEQIATDYTGNICWQVQEAARVYLISCAIGSVDAGQIYRGLDSENLKTPRVVAQCKRATVDLLGAHNWNAELAIIIRSNADDSTEDEHARRVAEVGSWFLTAECPTLLTASLDSFTVFSVHPTEQAWDVQSGENTARTWVSELRFNVRCMSADETA